jgi:response regulator RpfG family c-di-GMP phosphodiesterase
LDFRKQQLADAVLCRIPFILLSGYTAARIGVEAISLMDAFMLKPMHMGELLKVVKDLIQFGGSEFSASYRPKLVGPVVIIHPALPLNLPMLMLH